MVAFYDRCFVHEYVCMVWVITFSKISFVLALFYNSPSFTIYLPFWYRKYVRFVFHIQNHTYVELQRLSLHITTIVDPVGFCSFILWRFVYALLLLCAHLYIWCHVPVNQQMKSRLCIFLLLILPSLQLYYFHVGRCVFFFLRSSLSSSSSCCSWWLKKPREKSDKKSFLYFSFEHGE